MLLWSPGFVFSGLLLGALPYWNALVFTASAAILFCLFLLFPCRASMVGLAFTAAAGALPQIISLRSNPQAEASFSLLHWGYVIDNPTVAKVFEYVGFTFGAKWPLIMLAVIVLPWFHRRFFLAISSLFLVTFLTQLSIEGLANHKFLNLWLVLANLFAAYGFCWLWRNRGSLFFAITGRVLAIGFCIPILVGGLLICFQFITATSSKSLIDTIDWCDGCCTDTEAARCLFDGPICLTTSIRLAGAENILRMAFLRVVLRLRYKQARRGVSGTI